MTSKYTAVAALVLALVGLQGVASAQPVVKAPVDKWVTSSGSAAGVGDAADKEATANALRKAVEESCGVFINSQSKSQDYKLVYDKVFANTVGYVVEYKILSKKSDATTTTVTVTARVSTQKFEEDWAKIAHTVSQEGNPRVIIAVSEVVNLPATAPVVKREEAGVVQGKVEDFFLEKGIMLMDRDQSAKVSKRDILLASVKDDTAEVAALGARFKADVVIIGQASAQYGKTIEIGGQRMHQFTASLTIRAIRTDSAQLLVSKTYGPVTVNSLQAGGGDEKALAKLAEESSPKLLEAIVEAWRKQVHVSRDINLSIAGLTFGSYEGFEKDLRTIKGIQSVNLREITEGVANIDVKYDYDTKALALAVSKLTNVKLEVTEFNANRVKAKVLK